jgi:hypothetical protein
VAAGTSRSGVVSAFDDARGNPSVHAGAGAQGRPRDFRSIPLVKSRYRKSRREIAFRTERQCTSEEVFHQDLVVFYTADANLTSQAATFVKTEAAVEGLAGRVIKAHLDYKFRISVYQRETKRVFEKRAADSLSSRCRPDESPDLADMSHGCQS